MKFRKSKALFSVLATACVASAMAAPVNLVQNGSFEEGLTGWTLTGEQGREPAVAILYNSPTAYPTGAHGESIPVAGTTTLSPDAAGDRAAYFVDDFTVDAGLTQSIFLTAGRYRVGFDVYAPANGYRNPGDARFSATIAGVQLADYLASAEPSTTWVNYSGLANVVQDGFYDVSFLFNTSFGGNAKDVVVDRVYAIASTEDGGTDIPPTDVPEPSSIALLGLGLMALRAKRRAMKK